MNWRRVIAKVLAGGVALVGAGLLLIGGYHCILVVIQEKEFGLILFELNVVPLLCLMGAYAVLTGYQVVVKWSDAGLRNLSIIVALIGYGLLDTMQDPIREWGREVLGHWRGIIWILQIFIAYLIYKLVRKWFGTGNDPTRGSQESFTIRPKEPAAGE